MIFTAERKTLIFLLVIMQIAINRGIKVAFVNAMVSYPNNITTEDKLSKEDILVKNECLKILAQCYKIQLRENKSADLLSAIAPNLNHQVVPDALFTWYNQVNSVELQDSNAVLGRDMEKSFGAFDFKKPYIVISGSSIFAKRKRQDIIKSYVKLVESLKSDSYNTYLLAPCSQDNFLNEVGILTGTKVISVHTAVFWGAKVLANAQIYISGRYHPSIMASLGGTPLICFESNSHKMVGLQELIGAQKHITHFDLPLSDADIVSISEISKEYIFNTEVRNKIKDKVIEINKEVTSLIQEI
jgi:polysaccharide pyruvyl transferase WcaK-like protein